MKRTKVFLLTAAGTAAVVCFMVFSKGALRAKKPGGEQGPTETAPVEFSNAELTRLLGERIRKTLPIKEPDVKILPGGELGLSARLSADGLDLPDSIKFFAVLLPGEVPVRAKLKISFAPEKGGLFLELTEISVGGVRLSAAALNDRMHIINGGLNAYCRENNIKVGGVLTREGKLFILP